MSRPTGRLGGRLAGWLSGWRPAVRIARRDALRARGRSALIVAMVALPVLALTAADVLARSAQLDPDEEVARQLGQTQARLESGYGGGPVMQVPDPRLGSLDVGTEGGTGSSEGSGPAERVDPLAVAPARYRVLTSQSGSVETRTRAGIATASWDEVLAWDPAFAGRYELRAGAAPARAGEVAVTSELFGRLGVELGGTVELTEPQREVTVTGVVDQVGYPSMDGFFARPGELIGRGVTANDLPSVYLAGDRAVTWPDVLALNEAGVFVASRAVLLDPPPRSAVPYYEESGFSDTSIVVWTVLALTVIVALAALEVTLLAGAAFAVGARRQARTLGLVAATGGASTHVRRIVLAGGLVLGLVGAVVGVALGLVVAAVAMPVLTGLADADFGHYDVRPLELLAVAALGLGTGLMAAALPARTAARQDPVVALTGRRGQVRTARKVPVIGLLLVAVGVGAAALGSVLALALTTGLNPTNGSSTAVVAGLIAGGAALAQVGLVIASPAVIGLVARWSRRLPLAGRLAMRDAARHRGRSAPAMAAVLTAVTGSTALLLYVTAQDASDRESYVPSWPAMTGGLALTEYDYDAATGEEAQAPIDPRQVEDVLRPELPPFDATVVTSTAEGCGGTICEPGYVSAVPPPENECPIWQDNREPTDEERRRFADDWRCTGAGAGLVVSGNLGGTAVGGGDVVALVSGGAPSAAATETLARGGVVVFRRGLVREDGTVLFDVVSGEAAQAAAESGEEPEARQVSLPATYVRVDTRAASSAVYSPEAAAALGLATRPGAMLLRFDELPSTDQEEAARAALQAAGIDTFLTVERGYTSDYGLGLLALVVGAGVITLGASGVATGLAQADARADHATLAAVGAAPRLRRTLAAAQALTIAGLGTALGIAAGFVPAVALIGAVESLDLVIPWVRLLTVLVVIPLLAGTSAWLLTRSRVPLERRVA